MALIECSECAAQISDKAASCVKCGAPIVKIENLATTQFSTPVKSGFCSACRRMNGKDDEVCIDCGANLDITEQINIRPTALAMPPETPKFIHKFEGSSGSHQVEKSGTSWWKWVVGIPVGLFVIFMVFGLILQGNDSQSDAKQQGRSAIKLCWEEQNRKSFEPSTQRFIASACEKMESDFRTRYNASP